MKGNIRLVDAMISTNRVNVDAQSNTGNTALMFGIIFFKIFKIYIDIT